MDFKKEIENIIRDEISNGELTINSNHEIEYTQKWLNEWLCGWLLDGYSTTEVMEVLEIFENFEYEEEVEMWDDVPYEVYPGHSDTYEINERIKTVTMVMKKIA